jgi:hypothetical protein
MPVPKLSAQRVEESVLPRDAVLAPQRVRRVDGDQGSCAVVALPLVSKALDVLGQRVETGVQVGG